MSESDMPRPESKLVTDLLTSAFGEQIQTINTWLWNMTHRHGLQHFIFLWELEDTSS